MGMRIKPQHFNVQIILNNNTEETETVAGTRRYLVPSWARSGTPCARYQQRMRCTLRTYEDPRYSVRRQVARRGRL